MAKAKSPHNAAVVVEFLRTGNPWIDAGIVGLIGFSGEDRPIW